MAKEPIDTHGSEHLYVTVTRTDDLVDDDGSVIAERIMAVQVTFDVLENQVSLVSLSLSLSLSHTHTSIPLPPPFFLFYLSQEKKTSPLLKLIYLQKKKLHCNGVPIDIGVSNIQVEAQIASNPEKLTIASEEEVAILEDSFDIGLATVEVTATLLEELKTPDGLTFRRLNVQERITEINGENVVQTEAGQQILDMYEDGSFERWAVDPLTGFLLPGPSIVDDASAFEQTTEQEGRQFSLSRNSTYCFLQKN